MKGIITKLAIFIAVILLTVTLVGCGTNKGNEVDEVISQVFSNTKNGEVYNLTIVSDFTFNLEVTETDGIDTNSMAFNGIYQKEDGYYNLTMLKGENASSKFGLEYDNNTLSEEELAELNSNDIRVAILSDSACYILGRVMFYNGITGSKDKVLQVFTKGLFESIEAANLYNNCDYVIDVDGSLEGETLYIIHGDGYIEELKITNSMVSGLDSSIAGSQEVTIYYDSGKSIKANVVIGQDNYFQIQSLNLEHYVTINTSLEDFKNNIYNYISTTSGNVYLNNEGLVVAGFDTTKEGIVSISVEYLGEKRLAPITVYDPNNLKNIELYISTSLGSIKGVPLSYTASVQQNNGQDTDIDNSTVTVTGFDKDTLGAQLVTFSYDNISIKKVVFVYDEETRKTIVSAKIKGFSYIPYINGAIDFSNHTIELTFIDKSTEDSPIIAEQLYDFDATKLDNNDSYTFSTGINQGDYIFYIDVTIAKQVQIG